VSLRSERKGEIEDTKGEQRKQDMTPSTNKHKQRKQDMTPSTNKHKPHIALCFFFVFLFLRLVCPMLPVSLD
jgi:hypothetical protein